MPDGNFYVSVCGKQNKISLTSFLCLTLKRKRGGKSPNFKKIYGYFQSNTS